jgi:hypothetical protein
MMRGKLSSFEAWFHEHVCMIIVIIIMCYILATVLYIIGQAFAGNGSIDFI